MGFDPILWYAVFVVSVTAHEAAHAASAFWGGDRTAYLGGQVSLNPIPHMRREPIGMVVFPLLTALSSGWPMGWASAPYDPDWERQHPRRAAWMAAAGPGANLALALGAFGLLSAGLGAGFFDAPDVLYAARLVEGPHALAAGAGRLLSMMLVLNLLLALLNLIPLPPLDGATAIGLVLPDDLALRLRESLSSPAVGLVILIGLFWIFPRIFSPVFALVMGLLHPGYAYG